jgi:hypothetical protein
MGSPGRRRCGPADCSAVGFTVLRRETSRLMVLLLLCVSLGCLIGAVLVLVLFAGR